MKTETTTRTLYTFDELTDDQKQKAIDNLRDINVDYEWWDFTPDDFALDSKHFFFDLGRSWSIDTRFAQRFEHTLNHILENHGEACDSWKLARTTKDELDQLYKVLDGEDEKTVSGQHSQNVYEACRDAEARLEELTNDFLKDLGEIVLQSLREDYEYRTSDEAIIETIERNEYEFTEDGELA